MTKVKICGLTNLRDALKAAELGADYLGFLVEIDSSEDSVSREEAKEIINKLPKEQTVFVTILKKAKDIIKIAKFIKPKLIQLHNKITTGEIKKIRKSLPGIKIIKAIHMDKNAFRKSNLYENYVDYFLLDTKIEKIGGTGETHDWQESRKIVKCSKRLVFLAGGLKPGNVCEAVNTVRPYAVDANSGVKSRARKKDFKNMKEFIKKAK